MPEVDYDALAKQHGAVTSSPASAPMDYDALAKEHGATESTTYHAPAAYDQFRTAHPVITAIPDAIQGVGAGVLSTARGISQIAHKVIPGIPEIPESYAQAPDSLAGGAGKFGEQAAEFAFPASGVSKVTKGASLLMKMAAQGAAAGGVAALQSGADPGATAMGAAAGAGGPVLEKGLAAGASALTNGLPQRLYQSALKPTWNMAKKQGLDDLLSTGLREQIPVSANGLNMVENKIGDLRQQISDGIFANAAQGKTVDSSKVLGHLTDLEDFYKHTAAPQESLDTLQGIRDQFQAYHGQQIPIDAAQKIKQNTYQELKNSYGQMASAKVEGLKQVARGLKDQISTVFPEVSALNERQSKLMGLDEALTRAVWRIENHQMMGIGSGIAAGAGGAIAGGPGAASAFAAKMLMDDPTLKSKLAIMLSKAGVKNASTAVTDRMGAFKGALDKAAISLSADQLHSAPTQVLPKAAQNNSQNPTIAGLQ